MIITINGIIVFHLIEWIAVVKKSLTRVYEESRNMLAFSYLAFPTRHEVSIKLVD